MLQALYGFLGIGKIDPKELPVAFRRAQPGMEELAVGVKSVLARRGREAFRSHEQQRPVPIGPKGD
jgi:hypothetical protein